MGGHAGSKRSILAHNSSSDPQSKCSHFSWAPSAHGAIGIKLLSRRVVRRRFSVAAL